MCERLSLGEHARRRMPRRMAGGRGGLWKILGGRDRFRLAKPCRDWLHGEGVRGPRMMLVLRWRGVVRGVRGDTALERVLDVDAILELAQLSEYGRVGETIGAS